MHSRKTLPRSLKRAFLLHDRGAAPTRKMSKGQKKHQRRIRQQYAGRVLLRMALAGRRQERAGLRLAIVADPMRNAPCQYSTMLSQVRWSPGLIPSMSV